MTRKRHLRQFTERVTNSSKYIFMGRCSAFDKVKTSLLRTSLCRTRRVFRSLWQPQEAYQKCSAHAGICSLVASREFAPASSGSPLGEFSCYQFGETDC